MIKNYPKEFLMHAEQATGSCQDLITMGAGPIYWNRIFNVEFLDDVLRVKGAGNVLQENLFTTLSSEEMVTSSRFFSILQLVICLLFRWLTGKTHVLALSIPSLFLLKILEIILLFFSILDSKLLILLV